MRKARHVTKNHFYSVRSDSPCLPMALPLGATATTAASGGNREELLGPRPAGCERERSRCWEPQPDLGAKRLRGLIQPVQRPGEPVIRVLYGHIRAELCLHLAGRHHTKAGPSHSVLAGRSQPQGKHQLVLVYRPQLHGVFLVRAVRQHQVALPLDGQGDIAAGLLIQQAETLFRH